MIATVLLIAFTVAVGGIISTWLTSLSNTATSTTTTVVEKTTLCSNSVLAIKEVTSVLSASADTFNVTIAYDYGSENLYGFNLTFIDNSYSSATVQPVVSKNFNKTYPFKPGQYHVFNLDLSSSGNVTTTASLPGTGLSRVVVIGMCQDTYPIQAECKASQSCMK